MTTNIASPIQSCPSKSTEEKGKEQNPELHWIKFLIQDESGKSMPNMTVQITLPDGSISENTSDENGMIEINNIDPGSCSIEWDREDYTASQTVSLK